MAKMRLLLLAWVLVVVGSVRGDIPLCDEHGAHPVEPFCMPGDYNKDLVPPTEGPLNVNVDIWVFEVRHQPLYSRLPFLHTSQRYHIRYLVRHIVADFVTYTAEGGAVFLFACLFS